MMRQKVIFNVAHEQKQENWTNCKNALEFFKLFITQEIDELVNRETNQPTYTTVSVKESSS